MGTDAQGPALCLEDRVRGTVLLATAANYSQARLQGSRGAGRVSRQNEGGKLLFTRYPPGVDSAKCYRRISSGEGSDGTPTKKEIVANLNCPSSFHYYSSPPFPILVLQEDPCPALPVLRKQTVRRKHLGCCTLLRKLTWPPGWQQPMDGRFA